MSGLNFPARPVVIKLTVPEVQSEFERQRYELELNAKMNGSNEPLTNEMFIAYLLDTRKQALEMAANSKNLGSIQIEDDDEAESIPVTERDLVDEHATEIIGHDDPEPKGTLDEGGISHGKK